MRLIGAKQFLKTVRPGTLCVEFCLRSEKECLQLIEDYKNGVDIFKKYYGEFYIFGDNVGSLAFLTEDDDRYSTETIDGIEYDCLFYYDKNIVGDASPGNTLQLVFESEDEWPEKVEIEEYKKQKFLNKEDIKRIAKYFLKNHKFDDETKGWALNYLETNDYYKDDKIVNYKGE